MIRILLVEDHASYAQALTAIMGLEDDLEVVGHVAEAARAVEVATEVAVDVAIVDLDLPGASGIDALTELRTASPATRCLVLTALTDDEELGRAVEAGAAGVLHKSVEIPVLLDALRAVADGESVLPAQDTSRWLRALATSRDEGWRARIMGESLTDRERQVLEHLVHGHRNTAIAEQLGISPETVQTHVRNLLGKLGVGSRLEAVSAALRLGIVDPPA